MCVLACKPSVPKCLFISLKSLLFSLADLFFFFSGQQLSAMFYTAKHIPSSSSFQPESFFVFVVMLFISSPLPTTKPEAQLL